MVSGKVALHDGSLLRGHRRHVRKKEGDIELRGGAVGYVCHEQMVRFRNVDVVLYDSFGPLLKIGTKAHA